LPDGQDHLPAGTGGSLLPWLGWRCFLIADQFTKVLILGYYKLGDSTLRHQLLQRGAGAQHRRGVLVPGVGVGLAALVLHRHRRGAAALFIIWMLRSHSGQRLFSFALACVLGGAIGNVVDRLLHGYVVDFLDFHWAGWHFPGLQPGRQRHHHRARPA
jgi:signal peptidase II